jgi:hypothetical protein
VPRLHADPVHASRTSRRLRRGGTVLFAASMFAWAVGASAMASSTKTLLPKSPLSGGVLMAQAIHSGRVAAPHAGGVAAPASGGAHAPSISVLPNVKASNSGTNSANEHPLAVDPTNPLHIATGANDFSCGSLQGFYQSDDGGATWRQHCMPVVHDGGCGDPATGYDRTGKLYIMGIDCSFSTGDLVLQISQNNGLTWSPAKVVIRSLLNGLTDKEWLEVDTHAGSPFANCVYVSWTDFDSGFTKTRITVAHSCDGGTTWTRVPADITRTVPVIDQFSDIAIAPNGKVYVSWMQCHTSGPSGDCGGTSVSMYVASSADGGNTWSTPSKITDVNVLPDTAGCYYGCFPGTFERVANIPTIDYDSSTNKLWAGFYNYTGGNAHAVVTSSTNGGATWSALATVNPTNNAGWIWLSNNDAGATGITFLYSPVNGKYAAAAALTQNGTSFTLRKLSTVPLMDFADDGQGGGFIGDYDASAWAGSALHAAWPDTRNGTNSVCMTGGLQL